jgi:ABC-2 type transport system permease protein
MPKPYSQFRAMMAITKGSLVAQFSSPSALIFGFLFPLFFILIFGSSNTGVPGVPVAIAKNSDTTNPVYQAIKTVPNISIRQYSSDSLGEAKMEDDLLKGRITAILDFQPVSNDSLKQFVVNINSSKASQDRLGILEFIVSSIISRIDRARNTGRATVAEINRNPPVGTRVYKRIDYILPGQLGFSLLSAGLFGVSFLFFSLKETLVLKRFNATPLRRPYILAGEALARVFFQVVILSAIILIGVYGFGFTLINGFRTYIELMLISIIGLFVFMGFGFVISGVSKNINAVPAITNAIGFPQFMLSGTFLPY